MGVLDKSCFAWVEVQRLRSAAVRLRSDCVQAASLSVLFCLLDLFAAWIVASRTLDLEGAVIGLLTILGGLFLTLAAVQRTTLCHDAFVDACLKADKAAEQARQLEVQSLYGK